MEKIAEIAWLKTELQSRGLRMYWGAARREGGAGPAEGVTLHLDGVPATVPTVPWLGETSPYSLRENGRGQELVREGEVVFRPRVRGTVRFEQETDAEGKPLSRYALLHGKDCFATTVSQVCAYWHSGRGCAFCGIGLSLSRGNTVARKDPRELARAARKARELDHVTHVTLTTGTSAAPDRGVLELGRAARAIKDATGLPIHAQVLPPDDLGRLDHLADEGVDTLGIHVETFSPGVLQRMCPSKHEIGYARFREAWGRAVRIFGPGQVSSFLIVGLGETDEDVIRGARDLAGLGVYPFIVPLRPIPGTPLERRPPPAPERMQRIYRWAADILALDGLSSREVKAGCVRCGACSALPLYERVRVEVHPARSAEERTAALELREKVFVREQGIFSCSDRDEHDQTAVILVAVSGGEVVGTVRLYPNGGDTWIGSRLAVEEKHRHGTGARLVRAAEEEVRRRGGKKLEAIIQARNTRLFQRLGWRTMGSGFQYLQRVHIRVEKYVS